MENFRFFYIHTYIYKCIRSLRIIIRKFGSPNRRIDGGKKKEKNDIDISNEFVLGFVRR